MRTLVIGAGGFVGAHLIREFEASGHEVVVSDVKASLPSLMVGRRKAIAIDIFDFDMTRAIIEETRPNWIVLLAAQSSVGRSWEDPVGTIRPNIIGSVNVLEAIHASGQKPRLLLIGSSEEYGIIQETEGALSENRPLSPSNPYAITKACQENFGILYNRAYNLEVVMARAFNHIGPGQRPGFVIPDFCSAITAIERGEREPMIKVGNLGAIRDFTDVRDVVRAYRLLFERGRAGEVYNVGSGHPVEISRILEILISIARVPVQVEIDPKKYRPVDVKRIVADVTKIRIETGWIPRISLETSLVDSLEAWRSMGS